MRILIATALLALALPAQAQMYKCVDARGKTQYSDKPIPGCRSEKTIETPPPPPRAASAPASAAKVKATARAKDAPTPKAANSEAVPPSQLAARCQTLREEQEWLQSATGKTVQSHTERVAQVERALRECH